MTSKQTVKFARLQLGVWNSRAWWFSFNQSTGQATRRAGAVMVRKES